MSRIKLEILGISSSQTQIGSFALVLGEEGGNRRLPIIIGGFEAQAIALEIENIKPNRPMTHDLIVSITRAYDIQLLEVHITSLNEGVFYSKLVLNNGGEYREIDARPSDAIAIAVRYRAPIFADPSVMDEAAITIRETDVDRIGEEDDEDETTTQTPAEVPSRAPSTTNPANMSDVTKAQLVKKLTAQIEEAIDKEDYERAARLRDEIRKIEG
jgi:bifunctional DNase/RNase